VPVEVSVAIDWASGGSATRFGKSVAPEAAETRAEAPRASSSTAASIDAAATARTLAVRRCETFISMQIPPLPSMAPSPVLRLRERAYQSLESAGIGRAHL